MRRTRILVLVAMVALAIPLANAADKKNSIGVFVNYLWPTGDYTETVEGTTLTLEADAAMGYGLAYRHTLNPKWDFGASLFFADHDVNGTVSGMGSAKVGTISWMPILLDANWHFGKKGLFYVGPTIGYAMWDKLEWVTSELPSININDQFIYGLNFGIDVPFGKGWAFNGNARYLAVGAETDTGEGDITVDVNPWLVGVGISYKF
jgi:outer membrane protein W